MESNFHWILQPENGNKSQTQQKLFSPTLTSEVFIWLNAKVLTKPDLSPLTLNFGHPTMGDTELIISVSWVNRSHTSAENRPQSATMVRTWSGLFHESRAHVLIWTTNAILDTSEHLDHKGFASCRLPILKIGRHQSPKEKRKCVMSMDTTKSAVATGRFLEISALAAWI